MGKALQLFPVLLTVLSPDLEEAPMASQSGTRELLNEHADRRRLSHHEWPWRMPMRALRFLNVAILSVLVGSAALVYGQDEKQQEEKPARQEEAKPPRHDEAKPSKQDKQQDKQMDRQDQKREEHSRDQIGYHGYHQRHPPERQLV